MAADITSAVRYCMQCSKTPVSFRKQTSPLKLYPAFEPLETVTIYILGPLLKSRRGFQYMMFTILVHVVLLRSIRPENVAQKLLKHWVHKYELPRTLLLDNGKHFTSKFFESVCHLLESINVFTFTYYPQTN